ncbi:hypothetical protein Cob_v000181 [Colletotrichum orbiculare MAFF 240422]|uniref:Secreted protein n=1 Tax=Colletotrichum orbiculare (strain 104-T / ATCC 96160 / CBS 514.97 / LARS 414 / MAFF 240422) TaxID=1213857 RepID=A0A484G997_COLOR|nr:hypothetical protein Cob_v000181 [Colletotrichum orbiculare MAFF 240422]
MFCLIDYWFFLLTFRLINNQPLLCCRLPADTSVPHDILQSHKPPRPRHGSSTPTQQKLLGKDITAIGIVSDTA